MIPGVRHLAITILMTIALATGSALSAAQTNQVSSPMVSSTLEDQTGLAFLPFTMSTSDWSRTSDR